MKSPYGISGSIQPELKDVTDSFDFDEFSIRIENGAFEVGFADAASAGRARTVAGLFIADWCLRNKRKIEVIFNHSWSPSATGGRSLALNVSDSLTVGDRAITSHRMQLGMAYVVRPASDSYSFSDSAETVRKAERDEKFTKAIRYYSEEVAGDDRPQYGIYKAIEELSAGMGGRENLARLAGKGKGYVDDVMQTTQLTRHARTKAKAVLNEAECRDRAEVLLNAYKKNMT